ncbi:hypothetical protein D3C74_93650 [compost metagenome]
MKTAKERLEALIEDIDESIAALEDVEVSESNVTGGMISVAILTQSKATALAALVHLEHVPAGVVINNTFDQMKEMSEERIKSFEEMWKDIESQWKEMNSHLFFKGENEMRENKQKRKIREDKFSKDCDGDGV